MTFSAIQRQYDTNQELRRRVDTAALNVSCPGSRSIHPPSIEAEHRIASRRGPHPTNPPTSQWHAPSRGIAEMEATTMTSDTDSNSEETAVASELGRVLINRQPNADMDAPPNVRYWEKWTWRGLFRMSAK